MSSPMPLCCLTPHLGRVCPDKRVMCCLCFERVPVEELNVPDPADGIPEDVCRHCAEADAAQVARGE